MPEFTPQEQQIHDIVQPISQRVSTLNQSLKDIIQSHEALSDQVGRDIGHVTHRMDNIEKPPTPDRAELYKALAAAQLEIHNAELNQEMTSTNYNFRYADLASVMNAVRKPLAKNGLAIVQLTADESDSKLGIRTLLVHTSGQTISDIITMSPPKLDPQGVGSCRTYMRRYAVLAMCGIAGSVDDDAERTKKNPEDYERISHEEIDSILLLADKLFEDRADWVIQQMVEKTFDITHVSQIKAGEANLAVTRLKNTDRREKALAKKGADKKPSPTPPAGPDVGDGPDSDTLPPAKSSREPGSDDA